MKVYLRINKAFKWFCNDEISFKGYFYLNDNFYDKENALQYLSKIDNNIEFEKTISVLNGVFSIIKHRKESISMYSDITRSFPIFYTQHNGNYIISDDIYYLKLKYKINNIDNIAEKEFIASNHIYGKKTLLKNVYQLQASEYLKISNNKISKSSFKYSYAIKNESNASYAKLKTDAKVYFNDSTKRLITSLQNRTAVIPLSSGFDSRLLATFLKKHNYKNVVCYTYGKKNSFEIQKSKRTAEILGFRWFFIEYNENLIANFHQSDEFKKYIEFAGKLSSMPNLQEYFAVKYLKKNQLIPKDAIFIPGYAGDLLGGSQYLKVIPSNLKSHTIKDLVLAKKITNYELSNTEKIFFLKQTTEILKNFDPNYEDKIPSSVFEDFDIKEKIAKYIFNSASFYTFFGYEFRFPFWDRKLLDFFKEIPINHKLNKQLFDDVLINQYFIPFGVYFDNDGNQKVMKNWLQNLKKMAKPFFPTFIKEKRVSKNDWNNYRIITKKMLQFLRNKKVKVSRKYNDYNEIITQWYIYVSKNGFN